LVLKFSVFRKQFRVKTWLKALWINVWFGV
jgi:hypothetical protein